MEASNCFTQGRGTACESWRENGQPAVIESHQPTVHLWLYSCHSLPLMATTLQATTTDRVFGTIQGTHSHIPSGHPTSSFAMPSDPPSTASPAVMLLFCLSVCPFPKQQMDDLVDTEWDCNWIPSPLLNHVAIEITPTTTSRPSDTNHYPKSLETDH